MMELERGGVLRRQPETAEETEAHKGWAKAVSYTHLDVYKRQVGNDC